MQPDFGFTIVFRLAIIIPITVKSLAFLVLIIKIGDWTSLVQ